MCEGPRPASVAASAAHGRGGFLGHPAPSGTAGFVMANGSLSSNQSGKGDIRRNIIKADLVDCIIALPGQFFCTTLPVVCIN